MNNISETLSLDSLIEQHAVLVKRIAHHLLMRLPESIYVDDLIQSGMIGLIEASKNYDPTKGASFETYAGIRIRGIMLDEVRKSDWTPRSVHRNARRIAEAIKSIENRTGCDARDIEVAKEMHVSIDEYHAMLKDANCSRLLGFDDLGIDEDRVSGSLSASLQGPLEDAQHDNFKRCLVDNIAQLPEKERLVIALHYDEELNLREIGDILGVSESRICQIHSQAMLRLRSKLSDWHA